MSERIRNPSRRVRTRTRIEHRPGLGNRAIRAARAPDPTDTTPLTFRGSWEADAFTTLLRNAIAWGLGA